MNFSLNRSYYLGLSGTPRFGNFGNFFFWISIKLTVLHTFTQNLFSAKKKKKHLGTVLGLI